MKRMRTFLKYALWVILFFIFSEFIINVGLNSSYKNIKRKDETTQVQMEVAQATLVNGRMKGTITNTSDDYLTGKYVRIDFYSKRDVLVGTKYIPITTTEATTYQEFSAYFELNEVTSYNVSIVDHKDTEEIKLIPEEWTKSEIVVATIFTLLIFW